jgi:hypothetical protein
MSASFLQARPNNRMSSMDQSAGKKSTRVDEIGRVQADRWKDYLNEVFTDARVDLEKVGSAARANMLVHRDGSPRSSELTPSAPPPNRKIGQVR